LVIELALKSIDDTGANAYATMKGAGTRKWDGDDTAARITTREQARESVRARGRELVRAWTEAHVHPEWKGCPLFLRPPVAKAQTAARTWAQLQAAHAASKKELMEGDTAARTTIVGLALPAAKRTALIPRMILDAAWDSCPATYNEQTTRDAPCLRRTMQIRHPRLPRRKPSKWF
jgi:hypothetical protein